MLPAALGVLLALCFAAPALAALSKAQLETVQAAPAAEAQIPLDVTLRDQGGAPVRLGELIAGRPSLMMFVDYRCTQLCGSMLGIAAQALHAGGLVPDKDFRLLLIGFNPEATTTDGTALRDAEIAAYPELRAAAHLVTGRPDTIDGLEKTVGFTAIRDEAAGRYAHPADLYVLTPDGHASRVLNALSLDPETLRLALVEAGQGQIGSLADRLHVLCYGLSPLTGASNGLAHIMLSVGGGLTLAAAAFAAALSLRRRRLV